MVEILQNKFLEEEVEERLGLLTMGLPSISLPLLAVLLEEDQHRIQREDLKFKVIKVVAMKTIISDMINRESE